MTSEDFAVELVAAVIADTSVSAKFAHDFRADFDALAAGDTRAQVKVETWGWDARNANRRYEVARAHVIVHHRLADGMDEAANRSTRLADQRKLTDPTWWRAFASVHDVAEGPEIVEPTARVGHVISYTVAAVVRLTP